MVYHTGKNFQIIKTLLESYVWLCNYIVKYKIYAWKKQERNACRNMERFHSFETRKWTCFVVRRWHAPRMQIAQRLRAALSKCLHHNAVERENTSRIQDISRIGPIAITSETFLCSFIIAHAPIDISRFLKYTLFCFLLRVYHVSSSK